MLGLPSPAARLEGKELISGALSDAEFPLYRAACQDKEKVVTNL